MKTNFFAIPLIVFAVAFAGSILTNGGMEWYGTIKLPSFTPPGWVIGGAWTFIFILATASALIFWNSSARKKNPKMFWIIAGLFLLNAVLNVLWSLIFFNQHLIFWAFLEAVLLWMSVMALIVLMWPFLKIASSLLMPYAGWVAFASYLTYAVWALNK